MKKLLLFLMLLPFIILAQNVECAFVPHPEMYNINNFSRTVRSNFDTDEPYVLNVQFHLVNNTGDTSIEDNPFDITEEHLLSVIAKINIEFNRFNIFFKYRGYTIIDDSDYLSVYEEYPIDDPSTPTPWELRVRSFPNNYNYANINVFTTQLGNQANFEYSEVYLSQGTIKDAYTDFNVVHEFGHALGLLHIFDGTFGSLADEYFYSEEDLCFTEDDERYHLAKPKFNPAIINPNTYPTSTENVTRNNTVDVNGNYIDPNYNADIAGDLVIDTNASFRSLNSNCCNINGGYYEFIEDLRVVDNSGNPDAECFLCSITNTRYCYIPGDIFYTTTLNNIDTEILLNSNTWQDIIDSTLLDCDQIDSGEMYIDLVDERTNFMHYASNADHFSDGQGVRMREVIEVDVLGHLQEKLNLLDDGTSDLSVLYEPYKGDYFDVGVYLPEHRPLFQPGFDYKFVECGSGTPHSNIEVYNQPTPYDDTSFSFNILNSIHDIDKYSLDYNNVNHPNHSAIVIEQIDNNQPRKCYNNYNRSASNGTIIKFEDDVINNNITIHPKNESEINDSSLIQNLESGLFTIQKVYNDGTQEQQTIFKNNNNDGN